MTKEKEINETNEVKEELSLQVNDVNNLMVGRKSDVKTFTTIEAAFVSFLSLTI